MKRLLFVATFALLAALLPSTALHAAGRNMEREAAIEKQLAQIDPSLVEPFRNARIAADIVALSKLDLAEEGAGGRLREAIRALRVPAVVVDAKHGEIPSALLFPATVDRAPTPREPGPETNSPSRRRGCVGAAAAGGSCPPRPAPATP